MSNWIGVPVLNCKDLTLQTVSDCLQQDIGDIKVLVVDNGSTDGTQAALEELRDSRIHILRFDENEGVGPAWNHICQMVFAGVLDGTPANHVLITNNDVRLRPDTYRSLMVPVGGFVTGVNVGSIEKMNAEEIHITQDPVLKGGPDFSCFRITSDFYAKLGGFPECFMAFHEDNLSHWMAKFKGIGADMYGVAVPYVNIGSQTIKQNPEVKKLVDRSWSFNKLLYERICGGPVGKETSLDERLARGSWKHLRDLW